MYNIKSIDICTNLNDDVLGTAVFPTKYAVRKWFYVTNLFNLKVCILLKLLKTQFIQ